MDTDEALTSEADAMSPERTLEHSDTSTEKAASDAGSLHSPTTLAMEAIYEHHELKPDGTPWGEGFGPGAT